jgi:hypothetical protein
MKIESSISVLEELLTPWQALIGEDYLGYRNHLYRMIHCCVALQGHTSLSDCDEPLLQKICIAACFHDIGIWVNNTVDYIPPSLPPARAYIEENGLQAWTDEIILMITEHHKLSEYRDDAYPLVELFRKADLVDFSLGMVRFGLDKEFIVRLKKTFPNAGFHAMLARRASKWFLRHPFNPAPMMKW